MASLTDKLLGQFFMLLSSITLIYYTLWVIILPLIDSSHPVHSYFLPREYAIMIPVVLGIIVLVCVGIFICIVMYFEAEKKRDKAKKTE